MFPEPDSSCRLRRWQVRLAERTEFGRASVARGTPATVRTRHAASRGGNEEKARSARRDAFRCRPVRRSPDAACQRSHVSYARRLALTLAPIANCAFGLLSDGCCVPDLRCSRTTPLYRPLHPASPQSFLLHRTRLHSPRACTREI